MNYLADEFRRRIEGRRGGAGSTSPTLAKRNDFRLGAATVRPSVRTVTGPNGSATVEPRVMQVLVALADAAGKVLTRDDLIDSCWNGQVVGDDSINRAIGEIRRIARETSGGFVVETIPRIGYRLTDVAADAHEPAQDSFIARSGIDRRIVLAGGLMTSAALAGGLWYFGRARTDPEAVELVERARQALRDELPHSEAQGIGFLRRAVNIEPNHAEAWGLLALALRNAVEHSPANETAAAVRDCESAARRALLLDPREGNALTALATMHPYFGDWKKAEDRLNRVLDIVPNQLAAVGHLGGFLQSAGMESEAGVWLEQAAARDPLSPGHQFRLAWKLWTLGRLAESDQVIDRALQLFPLHPAVWNARMVLFALTGRPRAARAMVVDDQNRPSTMKPPAVASWLVSLEALESRSPADIEAAKRSQFAAVMRTPGAAINGVMILSVLGEIDAAFEIANGYLLRRGSLIGSLRTANDQMAVNDQRWRKTKMLFTPAVAAMQADARFMEICEGIGLTTYWRDRGTQPDFLARS